MCLYTKRKFPKIAFKDIECYKILVKHPYSSTLMTPYVRSRIPEDLIMKGKYFKSDDSFRFADSISSFSGGYKVEAGYIHSYRMLSVACFNSAIIDGSIIYKCIIPKGTLYYEGKWNDLASRKIKFIRQI